jgi:hypothetical protein
VLLHAADKQTAITKANDTEKAAQESFPEDLPLIFSISFPFLYT